MSLTKIPVSMVTGATAASDLAASSGAGLVGYLPLGTGAGERAVEDKLHEFKSILDYIPKSQHAAILNYTSVYDASADFQRAMDDGISAGIPAGLYFVPTTVRTKHTNTYYNATTGAKWFGDGINTIITQNKTLATDVVNYASEAVYNTQPVFAVHGSNYIFENMRFVDCINPFYFGQDPRQPTDGTQDSHASFNRFKNIIIYNCGTAFHSAVALGFYYNTFEDIHMYQCQIGFHARKGGRWASALPNNNRNTFKNVRAARCLVGLFMENGDTNNFLGFHCEGNAAPPTNNRYAMPAIATDAGIAAPIGHYFGVEATNNYSHGCIIEACDITLINSGYRNSFIGLYREDETGKVIFNEKPAIYISRSAFLTPTTTELANTRTDVYLGAIAGVRAFDVPVQLNSEKWQIQASLATIDRHIDLGAFASGEVKTITLQADAGNVGYLTNASGVIECQIVGNANAANLAYVKNFSIVYKRNSSRTPARSFIYNESNARATGIATGDATEPFTVTTAVSTKDITLTITAPARVFEGAVMLVRERRTFD